MTEYFTSEQGRRLAYNKTQGSADLPGVVFLSGFMSDMSGSKATAFEEICKARGQSYLRFDYSGHGESDGQFTQGSIGQWMQDALAALDQLTDGPQILVGSSMGGWIALLVALQRKDRIQGIVGIAAAPDFVTEVFESSFSSQQKHELAENGLTYMPSGYEKPYPISRGLIEDGANHRLLHSDIDLNCPVRLVQGTDDEAVAFDKPARIKAALTSDDVDITMIKGGNHSLSRPEDIEVIDAKIMELSGLPV